MSAERNSESYTTSNTTSTRSSEALSTPPYYCKDAIMVLPHNTHGSSRFGRRLLILLVIVVLSCISFSNFPDLTIFNMDLSTSFSSKDLTEAPVYSHYIPSWSEETILDNADRFGFDPPKEGYAKGCVIWNNRSLAPELHDRLHQFLDELKEYNRRLQDLPSMDDHRHRLQTDADACDALELHPQGLPGIFPSGQLSWSASGWIEPLFPPFRHPLSLCETPRKVHLLDTSYMVHDYAFLCRKLKPHSRTVLIDMGAALDFHKREGGIPPPVQMYNAFRKLGFHFDHIYAFEMQDKVPAEVYELLPSEYMASFHWINIGVDPNKKSPANPLYNILLRHYNEDDFVVIKLDIDTSSVELQLVYQMIQDVRFHNLIDVLYFEHHVMLDEIKQDWKNSSHGSVKYSLELFHQMRSVNIPAHYWI
jgi:hypothetical protein